MISKKILKDYGFTAIENYFEMVIESHINGQHKQAVEQVKTMDKQQKKQYVNWLRCERGYDAEIIKDAINVSLQLI